MEEARYVTGLFYACKGPPIFDLRQIAEEGLAV